MNGTKSEAHFSATLVGARGGLFDDGRVVAAAALQNALFVGLIGMGLVVVPRVSEVLSAAIGIEVLTGQIILSLLWAGALIPAYQWLRSEDAKLLRRARAAQRALRRYVPDALATQLEHGCNLQGGVCEVSVLIADICGFTALAEGRAAAEIFSIVNPYIQMVSLIVRRHGGYVAEFRGDGLMAIFGAPNPLPQKERAAIDAGLAIVEAMDPMRVGAQQPGDTPMSVRVGVATGTDYVGEMGAGDYVVWSAVGNTTNLADRLQNLTRQFGAAIIIDARTHAACGDATLGFRVRQDVTIRGRRGTEDVYVLPLPTASSAPRRTHATPLAVPAFPA